MPFTASDIVKIILAVILPPLGVFLERGCGGDLLINILLTILGYIPGIIHALYIILKYQVPPADREPRMQNFVIWQGIVEGVVHIVAERIHRFQRRVTFYEWRARHGLRIVGDVEANAGGSESSAGPDDGVEVVDMENVHIDIDNENNQQQHPDDAPAQAHQQHKQQPLSEEQTLAPAEPSAVPSSAPTVVASSSAPTVAGDETPKRPSHFDEVRVDDANILAPAQGQQPQVVGQQAQGQPAGQGAAGLNTAWNFKLDAVANAFSGLLGA